MDKRKRIKELVEILNKAAKSYYADAVEIMPNIEYDKLYDELLELEKENKNLEIKNVKIKNPNNPAKLKKAKLITFKI